ncbi:MAG: DUF4402 domain-containing protein [Paludibacteraceae bacterium]|nr:DUF4402 domain-containing protein [Paludibacteraceae bacterium]
MKRFIVFFICVHLFFGLEVAMGQSAPNPPDRTGTLRVTQTLHFGDIALKSPTSSGSVTVDFGGTRIPAGDVILLNMGNTAKPAIFEFKLCPGRTVTITYSLTVPLTASNGNTITLHIGPTNLGSSGAIFISNKGCDDTHLIKVGGTIDILPMSFNQAGLYTGSFDLTFNQQ